MRLYGGSSKEFIEDATHNQITELLRDSFFNYYRRAVGESEIRSWQNSLRAMKDVIEDARLFDHGVLVEYQLPMTSKRLDFMICGKDENLRDNAVIVELKQWEKCTAAEGEYCMTWIGGANREVLHPSVQVAYYAMYLKDAHTAFYEGPETINLAACAYLHNYVASTSDELFAPRFKQYTETSPVFTSSDFENLKNYLTIRLKKGRGLQIMRRVDESKYRPSKQLLDHIAGIINGLPEYVLLDDQLIAYEKVCLAADKALKDKKKRAILIRGGPGTGKSVIALNLMAKLSSDGYNTHYVTGSRAFTATLRQIIGRRGAVQVKNFSSYMTAERESIDVMICDEAHRMWLTSKNRFLPKARQSGHSQIEELFDASKLVVFLIDDKQVVRPEEIGSSEYVINFANKKGYPLQDYKLTAQFRCLGSDAFINWITNTLEVEETPEVTWNADQPFDFRILKSVHEMDELIRQRLAEGQKARLVAGFCWPWSDPNPDGTLTNDVKIGTFQRPWNAKPDKGHLAKGIPAANLWAYDKGGVDQVGCIYTAQGFEFDYVGVIFGKDLMYRNGRGWVGDSTQSFDPIVRRSRDKFVDLVKNTYRVLLTRGLKGCYVCFQDEETEVFFRSRLEQKA
jgi:DUF2075 family protein